MLISTSLYFLLITVIRFWNCSGLENAKVINCYYGTWSNYRTGDGKFEPSNINPFLCTHLSYSFFGISETGEFRILDEWLDLDSGLGLITRTMALKQSNLQLKVLAVVGGWNEGSDKYSQMAANAKSRHKFIASTLNFIRQYGFDGLDLEWEYPAQRGGSQQDMANFVTLLKELKEAFDPFNLELSIAVGASENIDHISSNIPSIAMYVNYINVMTYDFATANDGVLGFNAPLKGQGQNNVESSIKYWLQQGAPASKLVAGLAFNGRSFQLSNSQQTAAGSPSAGAGSAGPFTQEMGFMGYNEICSLVKTWTYKWSHDNDVPYIYNSNQWIGYDNVQSIELKMDFINSLNLAGAMVWSIETDDFLGKCGEKYPLLKAINKKLGNLPRFGKKRKTRETPQVKSRLGRSTNKDEDCLTNGFFGNATDCSRLYQCANGIRYDMQCFNSLCFDIVHSVCMEFYQCKCRKYHTTTSTTTIAPYFPKDGDCSKNGFFGDPNDCTRFYHCANGIRYDLQCLNGLCFDYIHFVCMDFNQCKCRAWLG